MFLVDFYAQQLKRQKASAIELTSGEPILLKLPQGEKRSNSPIGHAQIVQLVHEIAPPANWDEVSQGQDTTFTHSDIQLTVKNVGDKQWQVEIVPATAAATPAPQTPVQNAAQSAAQGAGQGSSKPFEPIASRPPAPPQQEAPKPPSRPTMSEETTSPFAAQSPAPTPPATPPAPTPPAPQPSVKLSINTPGEPKINRHLRKMIEVGASDLHMSSAAPPLVRLHGEISPLFDDVPLSQDELRPLLMEIIPEDNRVEFEETSDADFAHTIPGVARFRANYFVDRQGVGAVFRQIPFEILTPDVLGLPEEVLDLCWLSKGLVLVTGPTGSGKSTTLASLIDFVNSNRKDHIITIEDPIEFVHPNKQCLVNQREVGSHTRSFKTALRAALREDPDIVLVGELRDLETIAIAVETAETGHLVFGTLHTTTAPSTVDRIIDQFPPEQQGQIRVMLAESLKGVISQVLCKKSGGGRAAAYEILLANTAISNLIREGKTFQLSSAMQTGKSQGMCTMNDSLVALVADGKVDAQEAYVKSVDKQGLKMMFAQKGIKLELENEKV